MTLLVVAGVLSVAYLGFARHRDATRLEAAARAVRGHLARGRAEGVARRAVVRLRLTDRGALVIYDEDDRPVAALPPLLGPTFDLDSVRLAPKTLRFNSRGQASPGSVYLYRGSSGIRIVCNFIGRLRTERL